MSDDPTYAYSTCGEHYTEGWQEFLENNPDLEPGHSYFRGVVAHPDPSSWTPDADWVLEHMAEQAYEAAGEFAEDYPTADQQAKDELEALLKTWAIKHCQPHFFLVDKAEVFTLCAEDFESAA